jgi:uncharacterized membrane protein
MTRTAAARNRIAPAKFISFLVVMVVGGAIGIWLLGPERGAMLGFDIAALLFLALCLPLFRHEAGRMRKTAAEEDANRVLLLVVSAVLSLVILLVVVALMAGGGKIAVVDKVMIVVTLVLVWTFGNAVYTLHYAHLFYSSKAGKDCAGLEFPGTKEPLFADFVYFAFTLGVAVQTSDVAITSPKIRNIVTTQCVLGFFFNLGVLALTINVLGSK